MAGIVVPFRGLAGKQRLTGLGADTHRSVVLAMLADVLAATTVVGETAVVTNDDDGRRLAKAVGAVIPNLADDVDTPEDLDRLQLRAGPHTQAALQGLRLAS